MFPEINGISVTNVPNDAVYDFVIGVSTGGDDIDEIASRLKSLVEAR